MYKKKQTILLNGLCKIWQMHFIENIFQGWILFLKERWLNFGSQSYHGGGVIWARHVFYRKPFFRSWTRFGQERDSQLWCFIRPLNDSKKGCQFYKNTLFSQTFEKKKPPLFISTISCILENIALSISMECIHISKNVYQFYPYYRYTALFL
jgi:hypothetical protein